MKSVKGLVYTALFAVLTGIGALVIIPAGPVPITLQTLFCLLAGAILGKKFGPASQVMYVLLGIVGIPVFSGGGSGLGTLFGPTGGYVMAFIPASYITGLLTQKNMLIPGMILATAVIYAIGTVQLKLITGISFGKAVLTGVVPFIPGDILKITAGAGVYKYLDKIGFTLTGDKF
ncbi:MAG: biotin transporter BioY [Elusimicrobiota bacterium]